MTCSHHIKQAELYYILVIVYFLKTFVLEKIKLCELKKDSCSQAELYLHPHLKQF